MKSGVFVLICVSCSAMAQTPAPKTKTTPLASPAAVTTAATPKRWKTGVSFSPDIVIINNLNGQTLGYSKKSGVQIITVDGWAFKDLNRNGKLDTYEDWRLPADVRAKDLAKKMSVNQIAGLMLYSRHQPIPNPPAGVFSGTYDKKPFAESGMDTASLTDQQEQFLSQDDLRHVLITTVASPAVAARWNNNEQTLVEGLGLGIPANNSSDPRNGTVATAEYNAGSGGIISMWPGSLGLAATFDPEIVKGFGHIAAMEYRALGIGTALSPQIDMATDPRWARVSGTFGEDVQLATDMARAYIDGFQTSFGKDTVARGWGYASVNAMVKHWPGGGSGESGRDAHYAFGKYAVYPGKNFAQLQLPFTEGAFKLDGATGSASAVMPYYTISYNQDSKNGENVANNYNRFIINDLLRNKNHYDGVICTDWLVSGDETTINSFLSGKSWGVEKLTIPERHFKILMAGVDQFGGNNDAGPVIEAYDMGVKQNGAAFMRDRFEVSAVRLLKNILHLGLFENPYLDPAQSQKTVGNPAFMTAGYQAQLKSIVMLKNKSAALPVAAQKTVYIPKQFTPAGKNFLGMPTPEVNAFPYNINVVGKYFRVTDNPDSADFALVGIRSPMGTGGYSDSDRATGATGYVPISLQYGPYKAIHARDTSIAGGDPLEIFTNRTYKNKTVQAINISDMEMVTSTFAKMKGKPVIVTVNMSNPMVFAEIEPKASAILVHFGVQDQALMEILSGKTEPSALLPMQMPLNMETVEAQSEDVSHDMKPYKDAEGNVYDFGFGLGWKGPIKDARTAKYVRL